MKPMLLAILMTLCAVPTAQAGAWLKEKGQSFASITVGTNRASEVTLSYYLEYGLTEKTTVGLDIGGYTNRMDAKNGYAAVFMRRSLFASDGPHKYAYELGFGGLYQDDMMLPTVKAGLSWGYGFSHSAGNGWLNVEATYIYEPTLGQKIAKLDGTLGVDLTDLTTGIFELHFSQKDDATYGSFEPSLLIRPRRGPFNIKFGAEIPHDDIDKSAFKLGVWHRF